MRLYEPTPDYCKNCGRQLKSKKKYLIVGEADLPDGHWTFKKKCKKCGYINITEYGE